MLRLRFKNHRMPAADLHISSIAELPLTLRQTLLSQLTEVDAVDLRVVTLTTYVALTISPKNARWSA